MPRLPKFAVCGKDRPISRSITIHLAEVKEIYFQGRSNCIKHAKYREYNVARKRDISPGNALKRPRHQHYCLRAIGTLGKTRRCEYHEKQLAYIAYYQSVSHATLTEVLDLSLGQSRCKNQLMNA